MRRLVGTIMVLGGILIAPPLWNEIAGGFWPRLAFACALASIVTGAVVSLKGKKKAAQRRRSRLV
jgi:hypothetical protein